MLRVKPPWSASVRQLEERDRGAVLAICDRDPVTNVFVSSRVRALGLEPSRLGAQMWGHVPGGRLESLCYSGANLVPVNASPDAVAAFADRALRQGRRCSSVVGQAAEVQALWALLRPQWGPAREIRPVQPVMVTPGPPLVPPDPRVRRVRPDEIDILWPACVAMFTEEVGVSPVIGDGGASYRARLEQLIRGGRAFARIDDGQVVFKAEIGAVTPQVCQVQGVWVRPESRGRGLAAPGMAAVVAEAARSIAPLVSLYVNDFNEPARAAYRRVGFTETGRLMSVLFLPLISEMGTVIPPPRPRGRFISRPHRPRGHFSGNSITALAVGSARPRPLPSRSPHPSRLPHQGPSPARAPRLSVVDPGLAVDRVYGDAPDPPRSPDPPQSPHGLAAH